MSSLKTVIPAKAGIPLLIRGIVAPSWAPAYAGVTVCEIEMEFGV